MRILKPLILAVALAGPAAADDARITVTGEGTVQAVPDIATISLGVTTQDASAAGALAANTTALAAVLDRMKAAGIEGRDIQTSNLSVSPNWSNYDSSTPQKITGYTATNMVTVTVRDLGKLGAVLDKAVTDGANTLNGLSFGLADMKPALDEARKRAVADALDRARLLTGAAGVGLGQIVSISENGGYSPPVPMFRAEAKMDAVPVAQGEMGISASVTLVFDLKQ
ncbi:MAG: SIMPL domain-containing protein [Paracoccaceae bacterium]